MNDRTLSYNGYCGSVEVSIEDDCLHGKILFISDLVTYEASSPGELLREFRRAVDHYLQKCRQENISPDKPCSGTFNIRISPELHREASIKAAAKGTSLNDFVRECIVTCVGEAKAVIAMPTPVPKAAENPPPARRVKH